MNEESIPLTPEEDAAWKLHQEMIEMTKGENEPSREEVEALLRRIREGMTTEADADLVQYWIGARRRARK
jgi:hypothetical protein